MNEIGFLSVSEAAKRVGRSRPTMARLLAEGMLPSYQNPLDRRVRLVKVEDVDALRIPRRVDEGGAA